MFWALQGALYMGSVIYSDNEVCIVIVIITSFLRKETLSFREVMRLVRLYR